MFKQLQSRLHQSKKKNIRKYYNQCCLSMLKVPFCRKCLNGCTSLRVPSSVSLVFSIITVLQFLSMILSGNGGGDVTI